MAVSPKILLILGSGKNIGQHVAASFKASGYKVALVSRSASNETTPESYLTLRADLSSPASVPPIFESVKEAFGGPPNVVVYNAATLTPPEDPNNAFTIPVDAFQNDLALLNTSAFVAAGEAVKGFETLSADAPKAFIYTGNLLAASTPPVPLYTTLGVGKSAASYWIGSASGSFKEKGYRFYYADQRQSDGAGAPPGILSGPEAAKFYYELAHGDGSIPWFATFVEGKGYVHFPETSHK